jgi:hypothetical protein
MDVMIKYFDELNDLGAEVVQTAGNNELAALAVSSQLQECQDRWDGIVQQMELSSKQVRISIQTINIVKACMRNMVV